MGAVPCLQHHLSGCFRRIALERFPAPGGIDPRIADSPKQKQRSLQLGKQLIEGLAAGDIEHRAKHAKRPWIEGGLADRLHQLVIDVGLIDVHLPQGAANGGGTAQVFKQQPLHHRAFQDGRANAFAGNGAPTLQGGFFLTEWPRCIQQHHPSAVIPKGCTSSQG